MTHRQRPRARFVTGGPTWDERQARANQGPPRLTKKQKAARKPLIQIMDRLADAVKARDWQAARAARRLAWEVVNQLDPALTREERKQLGEYKQRILEGERRHRPSEKAAKRAAAKIKGAGTSKGHPRQQVDSPPD
jgi:predicted metalloendopeptidase